MLHLICESILSMYCQCCYSVCKPDIDLVLDVHPVERPARAYRNTSRAPRGRCLDPHVQVFLLDEHLGQGRYPIRTFLIIDTKSKVQVYIQFTVQSTLVISKSKGPSETLRDIRTSTYQMCRIEENTNRKNK